MSGGRHALRFFVSRVALYQEYLDRQPEAQARRDALWVEQRKRPWRILWTFSELMHTLMHMLIFGVTEPIFLLTRFLGFLERPLFWLVTTVIMLWLLTFSYIIPGWTFIWFATLELAISEPLPSCPVTLLDLGWTPLQLEFAMHVIDVVTMTFPLGFNQTHVWIKGARILDLQWKRYH